MRPVELFEGRNLIVCVGSGGVGKTSVSAAIAVEAAGRGLRTLVLTIDPARRLANALGLSSIGNIASRVGAVEGELWAMMLDTRSTFDALIDRISPDEETRSAIRENRIYKTLSNHFSGSQEYMANEALYDLINSERYDLIVLDTPPAKNALDFLDASSRLAKFLDPRIIKWFIAPYKERRGLSRLMAGSSAVVFRLLGHVFGKDFLADFSEFLRNFELLYEGFRQRHESISELLKMKSTSFVAICGPSSPSIEVATFFIDELHRRELPFAGVVVNKVLPCRGVELDVGALLEENAAKLSLEREELEHLKESLGVAHEKLLSRSATERTLIEGIERRSGEFLVVLPRVEGEVHTLPALQMLGSHLFADGEEAR